MPLDIQDKETRAKLAVDYYIKREGLIPPRPDGEEDRKLDLIIDSLAKLVVELAVRFSESAQWMCWSGEYAPPVWLTPFLTQAEMEGKGPACPPQTEAEEEPKPQPKPQPTKAPKKKGKFRLTKAMTDLSSPEFIGLRPEYIQYLLDHYDELPDIDPETGKPSGLIC